MLLIGTFRHVCIAASSLPAGALIICVLLCLATKSCVKTHCTDTNFLPSLSAAVGSNEPQRTIWIISILISSAWRLLILCNSYINSCKSFSSYSGGHLSVSNLPYLSSFIEIFSLNMLSIVSSSDNYIQHRNYFCAFALFSVVYMTTDVYVLQLRLKTIESSFLSNILRKKIRLMTFYLVCLLVLILCFWIHMTFCPPYAYTVFSAVEYAAIFANIIYHYTTSNTFEDISMRKMITYFCTGRTIPFVNMKSEQPLLEVK
ncbi:putative fgf receptor activating protein [Schistosoma mansoni]|uniref:Putative fgf receptor activating protein n=1 Tax=Schistosoma mansoni TaxID=6183 RepID=G4VJ18_SCHMA|nr:putative fgf receptor activating protein [Schistosoma mansoni]|eukprot:XP_018652024.1 putative fgf receptor activating protein [Schistosoma mansoni]